MVEPAPDTPLRILFVCGCLEPGRDGVGDYTRRLAGQLSAMGHRIAIAAVADSYVASATRETLPSRRDVSILRLPAGLVDDRQREELSAFADAVAAQWISLQFVPWSFDRRGVVIGLARRLQVLTDHRLVHVMCHELWITDPGPVRHWVLGGLQRHAIRRLLRRLGPHSVESSIDGNTELLASIGVDATTTSLFGNIDVRSGDSPPPADPPTLLFFGTPPFGASRVQTLDELRHFAFASPLRVVVCGGADAAREEFVEELRAALDGCGVEVSDKGFVDDEAASDLMLSSHVGFCRNAAHHLGKSSSLMTMVEHGLPIWAPLAATEPAGAAGAGVLKVRRSLTDAVALGRTAPRPRLPEVAHALVESLKGSSPPQRPSDGDRELR